MKQSPTLRALFVLLISASIISSCEKADLSDKKVVSCTTEFTGESTNCSSSRQVIYRFTSANDESYIRIQGDLADFTGADAVIAVSGASLNVTQLLSANSTDMTIKLEGAVMACQEVNIIITWHSAHPGGIVTGDWSVTNALGTELVSPVPGMKCSDE